jgi:hypothetical protein
MRKNGVSNFPDPGSNGGFELGPGIDPSSPGFESAESKCEKLLPGGRPGSGGPPSSAALAAMLRVAQCMRRHGISDFPDPTSTVPSNRAGVGDIADRDGVILIFPPGFDEQSPLFVEAAAACGFQLTNHG